MGARFVPLVLALLLVTLAVGGMAGRASAQEQPPPVSVNQVQAGSYPEITAVVTVRDDTGVPEVGLPPPAFSASEGGEPLTVAGVEQVQDASLPLAVVLVIDVSGSMQGQPLASAQSAAVQFVQQLGAADEAALFAFNAEVRQVVPFTSDKQQLIDAINGLQAAGDTSLYEAVQTGVFASGSAGTERRAVVILSDGENESSSPVTQQGSLDAAATAGVPVFAIGFGQGADAPYLADLAARTQGQYLAASAGDVSQVYGTIAQLLRSQYVVRLVADGAADGAESTLTVTVEVNGEPRTSAPVTFTRGTAPPPTAAPTATAAPVEPPAEDDGGGGASPMLFAVAGLVGIAAIGGGGVVAVRRMRSAREQREREQHAGQLSDEPLPPPVAGPAFVPAPDVDARIVMVTGEQAGTSFEVGMAPITIGSHPEAEVRVQRGPEVAPRHAQVWVRDGKIMLRHTGGSRATLVQGRPADWVILEEGDEFTIGGVRYRAEIARRGSPPA